MDLASSARGVFGKILYETFSVLIFCQSLLLSFIISEGEHGIKDCSTDDVIGCFFCLTEKTVGVLLNRSHFDVNTVHL